MQQKTALQQEMVEYLEIDLKDMLRHSYSYLCDKFGDTKEGDEQYEVIMSELLDDADRCEIEKAVCDNSSVTDELIQYFLEKLSDYFFGEWCNINDFEVALQDDVVGESIATLWKEGCPKEAINLLKKEYISYIDGHFDLIETFKA